MDERAPTWPAPASTTSWWQQCCPSRGFAPLAANTEADVVVVGGGVTGCSTAWHLARAGARVTLLEATIFGRIAMGEHSIGGVLADRWRLRRDDRLVFADDLRLEGEIGALLDRKSCGAGARATALLVHLAPDAEAMLEPLRESLASAPCQAGASAWNGLVAVRLLSAAPELMRAALKPLLEILRGRPAPRVWQ